MRSQSPRPGSRAALTATVRLLVLRQGESVPAPTPMSVGGISVPAGAERARVVGVIDGDTVVLSGIDVGEPAGAGRKARLIGIDTPEVHGGAECYGAEASAFTKRELAARDVLVDFDVQKTDRYGRALVYVWTADGAFFNGRLAAEGFAQQLTVPPNIRYAEPFRRLVSEARSANRGLWGRSCADDSPAASTAQPLGSRDCDASYPDFCISPPPPDLDCADVAPHRDFTVRQPDPHRFDADRDGVGCES